MSKHPYRAQARQALERAKNLLGEDQQLRYAALDLRLAMEALTYDRAQGYLEELPLGALAKWQPKQLMDALIEIDPTAGSTYTLRMGEEPALGVAPETMSTLGTDVVFGLKEIKKHYQAVSSFLHMPTMQQHSDGKGWDVAKVRSRLEEVAQKIDASLSSSVWNCTLGDFSNFECCRCDKPIHKRVPQGTAELIANCLHCSAPHAGRLLEDGSVEWKPMTVPAPCPTIDCSHAFDLWQDEIKRGTCWECSQCHKRYQIDLAILPDDSQVADGPSDELEGVNNG
jgi:hypothetical protein